MQMVAFVVDLQGAWLGVENSNQVSMFTCIEGPTRPYECCARTLASSCENLMSRFEQMSWYEIPWPPGLC